MSCSMVGSKTHANIHSKSFKQLAQTKSTKHALVTDKAQDSLLTQHKVWWKAVPGCLHPTKAGIFRRVRCHGEPDACIILTSLLGKGASFSLGGLNFASCCHQSSLQPLLKLEVATQAPCQAPGRKIHTSVMVLCFLRSFAGAAFKFLVKV